MTLGLTNTSYNVGLTGGGDAGGALLRISQGAYGVNASPTGSTSDASNASIWGITTDPSKSGMIVEEEFRANFCIRY